MYLILQVEGQKKKKRLAKQQNRLNLTNQLCPFISWELSCSRAGDMFAPKFAFPNLSQMYTEVAHAHAISAQYKEKQVFAKIMFWESACTFQGSMFYHAEHNYTPSDPLEIRWRRVDVGDLRTWCMPATFFAVVPNFHLLFMHMMKYIERAVSTTYPYAYRIQNRYMKNPTYNCPGHWYAEATPAQISIIFVHITVASSRVHPAAASKLQEFLFRHFPRDTLKFSVSLKLYSSGHFLSLGRWYRRASAVLVFRFTTDFGRSWRYALKKLQLDAKILFLSTTSQMGNAVLIREAQDQDFARARRLSPTTWVSRALKNKFGLENGRRSPHGRIWKMETNGWFCFLVPGHGSLAKRGRRLGTFHVVHRAGA